MESGGVSQIFEVQRQLGQVTNTNNQDTKQSRVHVNLFGVQTGVPEHQTQTQPFLHVSKTADQCHSERLR